MFKNLQIKPLKICVKNLKKNYNNILNKHIFLIKSGQKKLIYKSLIIYNLNKGNNSLSFNTNLCMDSGKYKKVINNSYISRHKLTYKLQNTNQLTLFKSS